jgi:hypothetical protein
MSRTAPVRHVIFCLVARQLPCIVGPAMAGELTGRRASSRYFAKANSFSTAAFAIPSSLRERANWSRGW